MNNQLALFDYQQLDTETRVTLQQRANRINERTRRMAQDIWENGREFYEAQQELAKYGYGCFVAWAESETGYKKSSVYNCIAVYQKFDFPNFGKMNVAVSALYLLAAPSTPDEARQEAIERAETGEVITYTTARQIASQYKSTPNHNPPLNNQPSFIFDKQVSPINTAPIINIPISNLLINGPISNTVEWTQSELERKRLVELGETVIANKRLDGTLIEWARENNLFVPIDRGTVWGNPFILEEDGTREEVIEKYRWYLNLKPSLQSKMELLKGKVLGCWCYPESCHGNILKDGH